MLKIAKKYLQPIPVFLAIVFLIIQVAVDLSLPTITSEIINKGIAVQNINYIWKMGGLMIGLSIAGWIGAAVNVFFASMQSQHVGMELRNDLFEKVVNMDGSRVNNFGDATLSTRATNDVTQIQNLFQTALRMMLMSPLLFAGAFLMAIKLDLRLTAVFAFALPVLAIVVVIIMKIAIPRFKSMQQKIDRINLVFHEGLTGVRVIRAFQRDTFEKTKFNEANQDLTHTARIVFTTVALMMPITTIILSFTNVGIVWIGSNLIGEGMMPVGNLVAFLTYATQILMSFVQLSMVFVMIPRAQASADRINEVLEVENEIRDAKMPKTIPQNGPDLWLQSASYCFPGAERPAINNVNVRIKRGQTMAIIGGTGSGKSTLLNLIIRGMDVTKGKITLNGVDIRDILQSDLHEAISRTQQKVFLFKGTIRSNLQIGKPNATDEEMLSALDIAQASEFLSGKNGLDTVVEQNGANFSGGQRQRIAIARTLVKDAMIYIFDDSFSALDFETDSRVRRAINQSERLKAAIKIIVAQRVSTVMNADIIVVLDNGEVAGVGSHEELSKTCSAYQEVLNSQLSEKDLKEIENNA